MAFSTSALKVARESGYDDEAIYAHLAKADPRFDVAQKAGYKLDEVASFLGEEEPDKGAQVGARIGAGLERAAGQTIAGLGKMAEDTPAIVSPLVTAIRAIRSATGVDIAQEAQLVGRGLSQGASADYGVDASQDKRISSKLIGAATSIVPALASAGAAPLTIAALSGEAGREEAKAAGADEKAQNISFYGNAAVGAATEALMGVPAILRSIKAAKVPEAAIASIVRNTAGQVAKGAIREGTQEALQQVASNKIASDIAGYEKDRPIMQGVLESFVLGMTVGGSVSGALHAASIPEMRAQAREKLSKVSTQSLETALADEDLMAGSPLPRDLISEELRSRDPGYQAQESGAPLTAQAIREEVQQPAQKVGEQTNENAKPVSDSERPELDRNEQRQGQRQGDERNRQGLQADEGNAPANRGVPEERSPVDAGVRDKLTAETPQKEPVAVQATEPPAVEGVEYQGLANGLHEFKDLQTNSNFTVKEGSATEESITAKRDKVRASYEGEQATEADLDRIIEEARAKTAPSEQRKLDDLLALVGPKKAVETVKPDKKLVVLQKQREELEGDYGEAKATGDKARARELKSQIKELDAQIAKATRPPQSEPAPPTQTKETTGPSEPAANPKESTGTLSQEQRSGIEGQIQAILKRRKLSSSDAERTALWEDAQRLSAQLDEGTSATDFPVNPEGTGAYSGVPIPKFGLRRMSPLDKATTARSAKLQKSSQDAHKLEKEIRKVARTEPEQDAISLFVEANGDLGLLTRWYLSAKGKRFKQAALKAQSLTPKQEAIALKVRTVFDELAKRGHAFDILGNFRDNYVPHVWDLDSSRPTGTGSGQLQSNFRFAKARTFATFAEGDAAGFTPRTLAIGKLLPAYIMEMYKVIADRQFVQDLASSQAEDGRPLVVPRGTVKTTEDDAGTAYLANPRAQTFQETDEGKALEQRDYKVIENQPALAKWAWKGKDAEGNPIFMKGDLALHPDAYRRLTSILGKSAIKQWYESPSASHASPIPKAIVKGLDVSQSVVKREMFGLLAPFHQVQEGTHAIGHLVNPFFGLKDIDLNDPKVYDAAAHGLMLQSDRGSSAQFMEGVGAKGGFLSQALRKFGGRKGTILADEVIDGYQDYLFHSYIPRLKYTTFEKIFARNSKRYAKELKSGEVNEDDIGMLSAQQTNAAYGHLNYALLDRNPTFQHLMQLGLLAPDFLEARGRFVGQAVKAVSSKQGNEQLKAIAVLALAQMGIAYTLAKLTGGHWDKDHPFEMSVGNRKFTMRSVPEDVFRLGTETYDMVRGRAQGSEFISARVNPTLQTLIQALYGRNYRGEKVDLKTTLGEYLAKYLPITARSLPGVRELTETSRNSPVTPLQQLAGSFGLKISRHSPISETYNLAGEWKRENNIPKDVGSYPVSKYQQLRYALEDGDMEKAKEEYAKLHKTMKRSEIAKGFHESVTHPFTGSAKNDAAFRKSLSEEDRAVFDEAIRARKRILHAFRFAEKG